MIHMHHVSLSILNECLTLHIKQFGSKIYFHAYNRNIINYNYYSSIINAHNKTLQKHTIYERNNSNMKLKIMKVHVGC